MRIPSILSLSDLPPAELQAGVLDGELMRVGGAYCAIDTIISSPHRAVSVAMEAPSWAIAERHTAAWIFGVLDVQPSRLQLCVTSRRGVRPVSTQRHEFREVVLDDDETIVIGGLTVTTPLRAALDIARINKEFLPPARDIVRGLASLGRGFDLSDCIAALNARRNLPHKRLALERLATAW